MLTANLKFINKNSFYFFSFFEMFYIKNGIINDSYFPSKYLGALFTENKHVQSCVKRRKIETLHCSKLNVLVSTCFLLDLNQATNTSNGVLLPSTLSFFALFKLSSQPETFYNWKKWTCWCSNFIQNSLHSLLFLPNVLVSLDIV
jgi:hypothetical protein